MWLKLATKYYRGDTGGTDVRPTVPTAGGDVESVSREIFPLHVPWVLVPTADVDGDRTSYVNIVPLLAGSTNILPIAAVFSSLTADNHTYPSLSAVYTLLGCSYV